VGYISLNSQASDLVLFTAGLVYLPEIKYRRILIAAFGPGGWALMPRGEPLQFQVVSDMCYCTISMASLSICISEATAPSKQQIPNRTASIRIKIVESNL
jgi:hypothetical protein